ncbi:MAG: rhodanese-like domain-containing protein, partial [Planctomycetota bacterium]
RRRRDPGLLEYLGRGCLRARIFPIPPRGEVMVEVGFRQVLPEEIRSDREGLVSEGRWIDVRDPYEFEIGRVPGTLNLPLSELGFHLGELRGREPLFLSCRSGVRSMTAARTLKHLGIVTEPVNVQGGILLWQERGFAIDGEPVG